MSVSIHSEQHTQVEQHKALPAQHPTKDSTGDGVYLPFLDPATASFSATIDVPSVAVASRILAVIDRYRLPKRSSTTTKADEGALKFLALIYTHVKAGTAVPLCLPAFPFKSPNEISKVLGKLPDRAEDLALAHLNGLCCAIQDVYTPGAKLTIISDGLVYNGTQYMSLT